MAQYDLIALDLDGTALTSDIEVAESTIEAIRWVRQRGCRVVVSTGRICGEAAEFAQKMGADNEMVTSGGAQLARADEGTCFARMSIPWESAVRAAALLERFGLATMVYAGEEVLVSPYNDWMFDMKRNEGFLASKVIVSSAAERIATEHLCVDKLFCRSADPNRLQQSRRQLEELPGLRVMSSASDNLEVVSPAADKGTALRLLCRIYGTTPDRAIAIGDSENDLEMLQTVGMPVAMANASDAVKQISRYVTASNDDDGIAKAIYHLCS